MRYRLISDLDQTACADLQDRGLQYGDGLFETMLLEDSRIRFWSEHYQRLSDSAGKLHISCPPIDWFDRNLKPYVALNQRLIIKIILTRGSGGRGIKLPEEDIPNIYLLKYNADNIPTNQTVSVTFSQITLPLNDNLAGLKHLNRLDYVLASEDLKGRQGYGEALLSNTRGSIIEGIVNNLFFVLDKEICTPALDHSGVEGIMRQLILKKLKDQGKKVRIAEYSKKDVLNADECFLCNSVQGIRPIIKIDQKSFEIGSLTKDLQQTFYGHTGS